jgi:hypothetical protein
MLSLNIIASAVSDLVHMEAQRAEVDRALDSFLAITKAQHFLLLLPFEDYELIEFLTSCYHRRTVARIKEQGFRETALFALPADRGGGVKMCLFLSNGRLPFTAANAGSLWKAGAFHEALGTPGSRNSTSRPLCYVFESNTLLERAEFYDPKSMGQRLREFESAMRWLTTYMAARDGHYGTVHPPRVSTQHMLKNPRSVEERLPGHPE